MVDSRNCSGSVSLLLELSPEMNEYLTNASSRALRSKSKEATVRLFDHLQNFKEIPTPGLIDNKNTTSLVVALSADMNASLTNVALHFRRTKSKEAQLRLYDHLTRFSDIACLGKRFEIDQG